MRLGTGVPAGKAALVMGGSGLEWTFGELQRRIDEAVAMLASHRLRFGDHIAVLFANEPELFPVVWAAQRTGLYYTPVNWHLTADEAAYIVADCGAKVLIASPTHRELTERISRGGARRGARDHRRRFRSRSGRRRPAGRPAGDGDLRRRGRDSRCSTPPAPPGGPRESRAPAVRTPIGATGPIDELMRRLYGLGPDSVYLSHRAAVSRRSPGLVHGGAASRRHRRGDGAVRPAAHPGADRTVPGHPRAVRAHHDAAPAAAAGADRRRYDLSSLRTVVHAAAPCPVELKREFIDWFGPIVWEYYAGSEGNGYFAIDSADWLAHPGSVGPRDVRHAARARR